MERNASDVIGVAFKGHDRVGIGRLDIVQFDIVMTGRREEAFVGSDAKTIHLRIWMLDSTGADARQGLPEPDQITKSSISIGIGHKPPSRHKATSQNLPNSMIIARCE